MKIISGKLKGRIIDMPKGIRPTSDKVRESLFEILKYRIEDSAFLDLYCGSGAIGIEAFSRGAKSITFVDNNPGCVKVLKKNLVDLSISDSSSINIYKMDALRSLDVFSKASSALFDIVFLDPPYCKDMSKNTLMALSKYDILARNAIIIAEIYKKEDLPDNIDPFKKIRIVRYGDTKLELYSK